MKPSSQPEQTAARAVNSHQSRRQRLGAAEQAQVRAVHADFIGAVRYGHGGPRGRSWPAAAAPCRRRVCIDRCRTCSAAGILWGRGSILGGRGSPSAPGGKKGGRGASSAPNPRILTASALPPMPRDLIHTSGGASSRRFRTCGSNRGALGAKGSRAVKTPKLAHFRPQSAPSAPEGAHPLGLRGSASAPEGEPHRAPRGPEGAKASGVERLFATLRPIGLDRRPSLI